VALANLLSLVFVTPVVAFFLLRDWSRIVRPHRQLAAARAMPRRSRPGEDYRRDAGGLPRGQLSVCAVLAVTTRWGFRSSASISAWSSAC